MTVMSLLMAGLAGSGVLTAVGQVGFVAALAAVSATGAWWGLATRVSSGGTVCH
jgi:hypothetical protein